MISASHMQYSLNHMLMANQQNPKTQIRWYNIYRENICVAWKTKILNPQILRVTVPPKKKKKSSSCNRNCQHCNQEGSEYNSRQRALRQKFLVKGVETFKKYVQKDSEEILGKMNYSCFSNNIPAVRLLNAYFGQEEEWARAEIQPVLFAAGPVAECWDIRGAQQKCVEWWIRWGEKVRVQCTCEHFTHL